MSPLPFPPRPPRVRVHKQVTAHFMLRAFLPYMSESKDDVEVLREMLSQLITYASQRCLVEPTDLAPQIIDMVCGGGQQGVVDDEESRA